MLSRALGILIPHPPARGLLQRSSGAASDDSRTRRIQTLSCHGARSWRIGERRRKPRMPSPKETKMKSSILGVLALVLTGVANFGATPPPSYVTTTVTIDNVLGTYGYDQGELLAKFEATSLGGDSWSVDASFKPHVLRHNFTNP